MTIKLLDYNGRTREVEIGDIQDIARVHIGVVTGDEIAYVIYKDYTIDIFDSSSCRLEDYYDCSYDIYDFRNPTENLLFDKEWLNRTSSYDYGRY